MLAKYDDRNVMEFYGADFNYDWEVLCNLDSDEDFVFDKELLTFEPNIQSEINAQHLNYLASTDWYVTKFAETGVEVPEEVATKRAEARASII